MEQVQFAQNTPKAKAIRKDLSIKVTDVHGTNIYDAVLTLDFQSDSAGYYQRNVMHAQVAALSYITLVTSKEVIQTPLGHIAKLLYQATTFKQIKALQGRTFAANGEILQ